MATEQGILQALWGEVRPAVEARSEALVRPCVALINRHKTEAALARIAEVLASPADREREVWQGIARRALGLELPDPGGNAPRAGLWRDLVAAAPARWANCRLFLDEPLPDRLWLPRRGSWILYRWDGTRFAGASLDQVRERVSAGRLGAVDAMLSVRVCGVELPNPKLPPVA